jgi:short-subunit dehydrogenase
MQIRGKNVLLTGASRGIGVYIARELASAGANLALVARNGEALAEVAASLKGVRAVALPADLSAFDAYPGLVARAREALGSIDVLINNAALEAQGLYEQWSRPVIEEFMAVDLVGPMLLVKAVLPDMLAARSGHVVNVASLAGKTGIPYNAVYSAAKGGLIAFSHSLRVELAAQGVGVSVVSPGFITDSGMFASKSAVSGAKVPPLVGSSTPGAVARGVRRAIERNRAEVIVNPGPMRLMLALGQYLPGLMPAITARLGMNELYAASAELDKPRLSSDNVR